MQALMLAAGMGKRLGKYTEDNTKCMLKVNGERLLDRVIRSIEKAGIKKLILVLGYKSENVIKYLEASNQPIEIKYIINADYGKTNNIYSLYLAKDELVKDDTILLESDLIFDEDLIVKLVDSKDENCAVVEKYSSWMDGTVVTLDNENNINEFIEKKDFDYEKYDNYYKTVNIYKFSKDFSRKQYLPFLEAYILSYGENEYYEMVLKAIAHLSKSKIKGFVLDEEKWYEIDDAQDLDIAETIFAKGEEQLRKMQNKFGGYWRYNNLLDYCYLVNPYFPPSTMIDKMKKQYDVLLTSYPSGLRIQNLNAGRMFNIDESNILVGNGAAELISALGKLVKGKLGVCVPTFNEYVRCFSQAEIIKLYTSLNKYSYSVAEIKKHLDLVDSMIIINPDNPSGSFLSKVEILEILDYAKQKNKKIIFDESFIDFADKEHRYTLIDEEIIRCYPNLIIIKSISKSYGVPGLRLGVMVSSDEKFLTTIKNELAVWNINSFAEYFLQIYSLYQKDFWISCDNISKERMFLINELESINVETFPSQANYLMIKLENVNSTKLAAKMLDDYNILIKDLYLKDTFDNPSYIRLAIRNREDNVKLISAMKQCLEKL